MTCLLACAGVIFVPLLATVRRLTITDCSLLSNAAGAQLLCAKLCRLTRVSGSSAVNVVATNTLLTLNNTVIADNAGTGFLQMCSMSDVESVHDSWCRVAGFSL
jgi:hypothetical protein